MIEKLIAFSARNAFIVVLLVLAIVGLCAWFCFRQLKLSPTACLLGALAAVLNSAYFSAVCWGVGPHVIAAGMSFFAVGVLSDMKSPRRWLKVVLAGFAVLTTLWLTSAYWYFTEVRFGV